MSRLGRIVVFIGVLLTAVHFWAALHFTSSEELTRYVDWVQGLMGLMGAGCCFLVANRSRHFLRRAWGLLGVSWMLSGIADLNDFYYSYFLHTPNPSPSVGELLGWFYLLPLALLVFLPERSGEGIEWRAILDFVQITIILSTAYLYFIYLLPFTGLSDLEVAARQHTYVEYRNAILAVLVLLRAFLAPSAAVRAFFQRIALVVLTLLVLEHVYFRPEENPLISTRALFEVTWTLLLFLVPVLAVTWKEPVSSNIEEVPEVMEVFASGVLPILGPLLAVALLLRVAVMQPMLAYIMGGISFAVFGLRLFITQRQLTHSVRQAQEAEFKYRALVEHLEAIIYIAEMGINGRFVYISPKVESILGFSHDEFMADPGLWFRQVHPDDQPMVKAQMEAAEKNGGLRTEYRMLTEDAHVVWISERASVVRTGPSAPPLLHGVMLDNTERRKLEQHLQQAQKMDAVGTLAGGIAHDFNNVLTVIKGYSRLLLDETAGNEPLTQQLSEIERASDRAASLTRQLLAFSRRQVLQPKVLSLNDVVSSMEKMLRRLIGEDVRLVTDLAPELAFTRADPSQMEQVIMNLAVNARDAMPNGGTLRFHTGNAILDEKFVGEHLGSKPGEYVRLTVQDTGMGMNEKTLARIFEPFFTTKELGHGTGLGLSMVYGIVKQSGGYIDVNSKPGEGTCFDVYLPRCEGAAADAAAEAPIGPHLQGNETLLLVEDDPALREVCRKILGSLGYEVLIASSAEEAETLCKGFKGEIQLLLTDLVMPGGGGSELVGKLSMMRPSMKAICMSGYTDRAVLRDGGLAPGVSFLAKPFSPSGLARKVREVLDFSAVR